jgi:hypothetical protein
LELLIFGEEVDLQGFKQSLILGALELWLLSCFFEHAFSLIEAIALDQTDNGIELHRISLSLS